MPLGIGSFLLYAQGPRADLEVAYLNAVLNGTGCVVTAGETSPGFSVSRTTTGVYAITFPKCRYCQIIPVWQPVALAQNLFTTVLAGFDPTAGAATLNISSAVAATLADPASVANELNLWFLLGF